MAGWRYKAGNVPPSALELDELKAQAKVGHNLEDALLTSYAVAATIYAENMTARALVNRSLYLYLDEWPAEGKVLLPCPPTVSVDKVEVLPAAGGAYADAGAVATLLDLDLVDEPAVASLASGQQLPAYAVKPNAVRLELTAGYGAAPANVPDSFRQAIRLLAAWWYKTRAAVVQGQVAAPAPMGVDALLWQNRVLRWHL